MLIHGFSLVSARLLMAFGTAFYAITTFKLKRYRGDLTELLKNLTYREGFNKRELFTMYMYIQDRIRDPSLELVKPRFRLNCRKFVYPTDYQQLESTPGQRATSDISG